MRSASIVDKIYIAGASGTDRILQAWAHCVSDSIEIEFRFVFCLR